MSTNEIVIYQSEKLSTHIAVLLEDETVWLTQLQMVALFQSTKQNISLHISNIFKEGELQEDAAVKYSFTTASDGKKWFAFSKLNLDSKEIISKLTAQSQS